MFVSQWCFMLLLLRSLSVLWHKFTLVVLLDLISILPLNDYYLYDVIAFWLTNIFYCFRYPTRTKKFNPHRKTVLKKNEKSMWGGGRMRNQNDIVCILPGVAGTILTTFSRIRVHFTCTENEHECEWVLRPKVQCCISGQLGVWDEAL